MTKPELEACINEYGKDIYSFCTYLAGNVQAAEDLYQDTFLKAVEIGGRIDVGMNPKSYLLSIALRIWKNRKRKFAWRGRIADRWRLAQEKDTPEGNALQMSPEEQALRKEETGLVRRAVAGLPYRLKVVVLLYYMEELTTAQIAAAMKIPQGTVKSRLYQARKMLEKELEVVLNEKGIR